MPIAQRLQLANALRQRMRFKAAEGIVLSYMDLVANDPDAFNMLGMIYRDWGTLAQSEIRLRQAVAARNSDEHRANLAMTLLQQRKWVEGWQYYAARAGVINWSRRRPGLEFWTGQPIDGRRILVFHEQVLGDMIQFARFLPALRDLGAMVTVRCDEQLRALLDGNREALGVEAVIVDDDLTLEFDFQVPQMSLPGLLGINGTLEAAVPYLTVPVGTPELIPAKEGNRRVAVVWATRSKSSNVRIRSCRLEDLAPICNDHDLACYSLQKEATAAEIATLEASHVHDLREQLVDMTHTAAALQGVRTLVSVDTAVAHLAGALGLDTVLMLHAAADWRWHDNNDRSSWYPTIRIVRQTVPGVWADVVTAAHQIIRDLPD